MLLLLNRSRACLLQTLLLVNRRRVALLQTLLLLQLRQLRNRVDDDFWCADDGIARVVEDGLPPMMPVPVLSV